MIETDLEATVTVTEALFSQQEPTTFVIVFLDQPPPHQ